LSREPSLASWKRKVVSDTQKVIQVDEQMQAVTETEKVENR